MKIPLNDILRLVLSLMIIMTLPACQKVINVDLNDAEPQIVIEGLITDRPGPYTVNISKSGSYFNEPVLPPVTGAFVIVSDNSGMIDTLSEVFSGVYITSKITGTPGKTYSLKVISGGQEYTGASTMSSHVRIDSLMLVRTSSESYIFSEEAESDLEIHCFFRDPQEKNYYRIKVFENDSIDNSIYRLFDDQYTNGQETELRIAYALEGKIYKIQLLSLDSQTYEYYLALSALIDVNPFFGSTPANPESNLSNGALGYFGTSAVSTKILVVPHGVSKSALFAPQPHSLNLSFEDK